MANGKRFFLFLALLAVCTAPAFSSRAQTDPRKDFIVALDETNIRAFLAEVSAISTGRRPDMLDDDVIDYFTNHLADKGTFKSAIRYDVPGFPPEAAEMELNKEEYINGVVNGRHLLQDYVTEIEINDLKIGGGGKSATFKSVTREKGRMPWIRDEKRKDEIEMIPITGESRCEQKLVVSYNNFIQMAAATCATTISFDPFAGKPLAGR